MNGELFFGILMGYLVAAIFILGFIAGAKIG